MFVSFGDVKALRPDVHDSAVHHRYAGLRRRGEAFMDTPSKKLVLSKETLCALDDDDLTQVVGGDHSGICVQSVVCNSGVCHSVICNSGALCQSAIC
jgi:hypothetical protein